MNQLITLENKRHPVARRKKRLYIVNRFRFVLMTLITLIILSTFISYISGLFMSDASTNNAVIAIDIVSGDTLWDIAKAYNYYDEDIREVVYRIKTYNHLESTTLTVGQSVLIPLSNNF